MRATLRSKGEAPSCQTIEQHARPVHVAGDVRRHRRRCERRVAGAVDHRLDRGASPVRGSERALGRREVGFDDLEVRALEDAADRRDDALGPRGAVGPARERDHGSPREQEPSHDLAADEAGGARHEDHVDRDGQGMPGVRSAGPRQRSA